MESFIVLKKIFKSFGERTVISDFSYSFGKNGFYLLYGYSGSGKSTLLNIIYGFESFDSGSIVINAKTYSGRVCKEEIEDLIAYISQDSRLIEYLNIMDNLRLCSDDCKKIALLAKKFKINNILDKMPSEISGGEQQRVIICQFLLLDNKIFLLDEVSSSLDFNNKIELFKLLKNMGKDKLIIFASHDKDAKKYADFSFEVNNSLIVDTELVAEKTVKLKKPNLYKFVLKQNSYRNNLFSKIVLIFVFVISLLIVYFCSDVDGKMLMSSLRKSSVNYLSVRVPQNYDLEKLKEKYNISEVIFSYRENISNLPYNENYDYMISALPSKSSNFPLTSIIKYGSYFTKEKQVILSQDKALSISNKPSNLIGEKIKINLFDDIEEFEIIGIMDSLNEKEIMYFSGGGLYPNLEGINSLYFINGKYFDKYFADSNLNLNKLSLELYFTEEKDLMRFYKDYFNEDGDINTDNIEVDALGENFVDQKMFLASLSVYLYPAIVISIITVIIFYLQYKLIDLKYNEYILGIYASLGFKVNKIRIATQLVYIVEIIKLFTISFILSILLSFVLNTLNNICNFTNYVLFSCNVPFVFIMFLSILVISILLTLITFRHLKIDGWLKVSYKGRDLL